MDLLSAMPEVVQAEVFKHLDVKSILNASQVCHLWNNIIGNSEACMEKITLVCTPFNINFELNSVLHSNRKYQRIKIYHRSNYRKNIDSIIKAVLKKFSKSINLIETTNDLLRVGDLPKLKELRIVDNLYKTRRYSYLLCSHGLVASFTSITKLAVQSMYMDEKSSRVLNKALKEMKNLKSLTVNYVNFLKYFKTGDYNFKLEEFNCFDDHYPTPSMDSFLKFLFSQNSSLKTIRCDPITFVEASFFLKNFPMLQTFHFHGLTFLSNDYNSIDISSSPINRSIKRLSVGLFDFNSFTKSIFINLLINLQNLQQLKVRLLFGELIPVIFECPSIKVVYYKYLDKNVTETQKMTMVSNGTVNFVKIQLFFKFKS